MEASLKYTYEWEQARVSNQQAVMSGGFRVSDNPESGPDRHILTDDYDFGLCVWVYRINLSDNSVCLRVYVY